jgi:DNA damage-regulated autophagy modulator protein 2
MLKAHIRIGLSILCTICFFVVAVTGIISHILYQGKDPRKWYPSDGGWEYHVASTISEWIVASAFSFYILTFTDEFRSLHFDHPAVSSLYITNCC